MTCIVGYIEKGKVYIGGDSAGVSNYDVTIRKDSKVFKVGDFVIGGTSSFRMIQLLRFSFKPPERLKEDLYHFMCTDFVDAIRKCFRDGGYIKKENEQEEGGKFLVGCEGRLFKISEDFQVGESELNYAACGCGEDYALGALAAMSKKLPAEKAIIKSLKIASYFSTGVRPPFVIQNI